MDGKLVSTQHLHEILLRHQLPNAIFRVEFVGVVRSSSSPDFSSPSARRPSSGFDGVNEDANVRANAAVVDRHADVSASAMMTVDIDDDDDDGNFVDTLSEILGSSSKVTTSRP